MSTTLQICILSVLIKVIKNQSSKLSEWQYYSSELVDNTFPSTGWNAVPPTYTCNPIVPPFQQFYDFTGQSWSRSIDLTQERGYMQVRIIFDLYIFQYPQDSILHLPFLFKFDGNIIPDDVDLFLQQNIDINCTYCNSRAFTDLKYALDFQINIPLNTVNFNHLFEIRPLDVTTQFSIKNFNIFINKCSKNCLQCELKQFCKVCKPNFQLLSNSCRCSYPKPFIFNDDCFDSCPLGYFDFNEVTCKPYASKSILFVDDVNQNLIKYDYIKDTLSNIFYKSSTYEADQDVHGPFRFNDKIQYSFRKSSITSILEFEITIYLFGNLAELSRLMIEVNNYRVATITYSLITSSLFTRFGLIKSVQDCSRIGFSSCKKVQFYMTLQTFFEQDIVLGIGSQFNISDPFYGWGIDQVIVNEIEPAIQLPLVCTLWYKGNCINQCPSYSTQNGNVCEDYDSVFKNPQYILKEFYPNYLVSPDQKLLMNILNIAWYQFESRFLYLFNTKLYGGGILQQKFQMQKPHRKLRLMISVLLIDWQNNSQDYFFELVVGVGLNQQRHKFYADPLYEFTSYQLNQEFPDYIYRNYTMEFIHFFNTTSLEFRCFSPFDGYCSFFDYFIIIEKCDHGCEQCDSNGVCLKYEFRLENQVSYQFNNYRCSDGYFYDQEQCNPCFFSCGKCKIDICLQCKDGFELKEGKCFCQGSQANEICKQQNQCPQQCQTCQLNYPACDSCDLNQLKVLNMNTCVCIKGYYLNQDLECILCNPKCITCNGYESCTSCNSETNRELFENMCECKQGYFEIAQSIFCQQCHHLCVNCYFEYDRCTECDTQLFRQLSKGKCVCQTGYYEDNQQVCQKCNPICYTCEQDSLCLSCDIAVNRVINKQQICICNQGYFENETNQCQKCHYSCIYCNQSEEFNQCTACPTSRIKSSDKMNSFECKCRKGYFDLGVLECISCKPYQNVNASHPCYSQCGDNILQWDEECDDGNNNSRDGCVDCYFTTDRCRSNICKKCYQGYCQICNDGYYLNGNNECQQCSQSCLTCITSQDNCVQCRFTLEDKTCKMCEQEFGFQIKDDKCTAICGDNILVDIEQCDDGNIIDGDGCNSQCQVEEGFICNPTCEIINPIDFMLKSDPKDKYFNNKRYCYLDFNQDVAIYGNLSSMINLQFNNSQVGYNSNITNLNPQSLLIEIQFLTDIENPFLQVEITTPQKIKNQQGAILENNIQKIQLLSYIKQSEGTKSATNSSSNFAYFIMVFLLSLAGFSFITGGLNIFFNLLDSIQMLAYLKYLNIIFPYNLQMYFETFGFAEFDFLKEYISVQLTILDFDFKMSENQPDQKFAEEGYSSLFVINILSVLSVFVITYCTFMLSIILNKLCNYYIHYLHNKISDDIYFVLGMFQYYLYIGAKHLLFLSGIYTSQIHNNIIRTILTVAMDFNMAMFLQLKMYQNDMGFSYYLSVIAFIAQLLFIYYGLNAISKKQYEFVTQTYKQKHESFLEGNPEIHQNQFVKYYNLMILIKKMMFMFSLIFLYHCPSFQILISSIQNIIFIGYIILTKPLKDINEFYKVILTECILWLEQLFILLIYYIQSGTNQLDQSQISNMEILGWVIIGLSVVMLLIQFLIDIKQHAYFLYQQYSFIQRMFKFVSLVFNKQVQQVDQIAEELIKEEKNIKSKTKIITYQFTMERKIYDI
ncbi:unnamed protein product (macronuclear) [Paramecium tetraurelia]|uniref:TNFR-Cys domain-containing protein n=1 Tax=Paramecium tetraurelia TaxID=5888 RepID=A0BVI8_PARTE|nr:uncharacterized protein GSPATT00005801001 [Paramecium tetraurelia]CAK62555.1 unnamed protein product [Paramecium tetraurelia]|eukprot:XP_001429953.1 hypothetical protein (macronuclear) [Paramecium tetraurelia strain d4-2]